MKARNFLPNDDGVVGAWAKLAHALAFPMQPLGGAPARTDESASRPGFFERLDRWLWQQEMRQREAYLAGAKDIFELEERMRRLDRGEPFPYY